MLKSLLETLLPFFWCLGWILGGLWITQSIFVLRRSEQVVVGVSIGFLLQTCLGGYSNNYLSPLWGSIIASLIIFCIGLVLSIRTKKPLFSIFPLTFDWLWLLILTGLFFNLQRGLGIVSDLNDLSIISRAAAGRYYDHSIFHLPVFDPHLFTAQIQLLANLYPWNALNLTRGLLMSLAVLLVGIWTRRLTFSRLAGWIGCLVAAFGMGSAWLVLLFPNTSLLDLIKSPSLNQVVSPFPLPDAFKNSLFLPIILNFSLEYLCLLVIGVCLLLTYKHWKIKIGAFILIVFFIASFINMNNQVLFSFSLVWIFLLVYWLVFRKSIQHPQRMFNGLMVTFLGFWLFILWNNHLSVENLLPPLQNSAHNFPAQPLALFLQFLPFLIILPLLLFWTIKSFRSENWFYILFLISACISLLALFFSSSPLALPFTNIPLIGIVFILFAPPLVWIWSTRKNQTIKIWAAAFGFLVIFGGLFMFSLEWMALPQSAFPPGLVSLDAQVYDDFWNKLDDIYDPSPKTGEVIFGRTIETAPQTVTSPHQVRASGYRYILINETYWDQLDTQSQTSFSQPCVKTVKGYQAKHGNSFRRLLDISSCE